MVGLFSQKIQRFSIKKKLVFLIIGISGFTLFLASSALLGYGVLYSRNALLNELTIMTQVIGEQSIAALEFMDAESAHANLSTLRLNKALRLACIYDMNGKTFAFYRNNESNSVSNENECPRKPETISVFKKNAVTVFHRIMRGTHKVGGIYIESDLSSVKRFTAQYFAYVAMLIVLAMLTAYMLSKRLQHLISAPILHLVDTAKKLSEGGDYSIRATKYSEDELGILVESFNVMLKQIQVRDEQLQQINDQLSVKVEERTAELQAANKELTESLAQLNQTQSQLVQSEKMAALGGLVAGVAHEINTPVGVGVTASSYLKMKITQHEERYKAGELTRPEFEAFLRTASESSEIIDSNLTRAAELIRSFKQVAVDQTSDQQRTFRVKNYVDEIIYSLRPKLKNTQHSILVECPEHLEIYSYPGAFSQIITNLVMNSLIHGFDGIEKGKITIEIDSEKEKVQLRYTDNGKGMEADHLKRIFDPFFTTKRGQGGSGLGMHVVFNLITQTLGGNIACSSSPGRGTEFKICIPFDS